jgi:hypothetical protein
MNCRQKIAFRLLLLTVLLIATSQSLYGQGKLGRIRDKVRENKPTPERREERDNQGDRDRTRDRKQNRNRQRQAAPGRRRKPNRNRRRNCDPGLGLAVGGFFAAPQVETVHVVHHAPTQVVVDPIPTSVVAQTVAPLIKIEEPIYKEVVTPAPELHYSDQFAWGVRVSAIGATDFDDIVQGSLGMLLQAPNGPGIDTSVTMIRESGMTFRDHLFLGDVNLVYEPIFQDNFRLRIGIGVNWLGDSYGGDAGFNITSGFDLKLTQRAIATGEIDFGSIGDTDITHARIAIGRKINTTTEWVVGYDHLDIGGVTIGSAFTGLQFRF